mmetsp:Transcript_47312/g.94338  ORF Transcript_47312/g.94338 Transcript_47312/m.94338 type:complete len:220 (-) Transcript_47312:245-904(-)
MKASLLITITLIAQACAVPCGEGWPPPASCSVSTVEALLAARDLSQISEILLDGGVYTLGTKESEGFNLWRSVTIKAAAGATAVLERAPKANASIPGRVMVVSPSTNVVIEGVTIRGGFTHNENGAGILNRGNLTLRSCVLTGNEAHGTAPEGGGGGLNLYGTSNAFLVNTTITANKADMPGGGVLIDQGTCSKPCAFLHLDAASTVANNKPDDIVPPS